MSQRVTEPIDEARARVRAAVREFAPRLQLACSFSPEDIIAAHLLAAESESPRVFAIDTGRLPEETYECAAAVQERLGIRVQWYLPQTAAVEALMREQGPMSFRASLEARHACCAVRKLEPLARALANTDAWMTGLRAAQSVTRRHAAAREWDDAHALWKINPLIDWTDQDVWRYVAAHDLPYNRLFDQGYTSIGCAACTRPTAAGEDPRAGRWWWEEPEHRECGLHPAHQATEERQ